MVPSPVPQYPGMRQSSTLVTVVTTLLLTSVHVSVSQYGGMVRLVSRHVSFVPVLGHGQAGQCHVSCVICTITGAWLGWSVSCVMCHLYHYWGMVRLVMCHVFCVICSSMGSCVMAKRIFYDYCF